jgi:hypothetical protein
MHVAAEKMRDAGSDLTKFSEHWLLDDPDPEKIIESKRHKSFVQVKDKAHMLLCNGEEALEDIRKKIIPVKKDPKSPLSEDAYSAMR